MQRKDMNEGREHCSNPVTDNITHLRSSEKIIPDSTKGNVPAGVSYSGGRERREEIYWENVQTTDK